MMTETTPEVRAVLEAAGREPWAAENGTIHCSMRHYTQPRFHVAAYESWAKNEADAAVVAVNGWAADQEALRVAAEALRAMIERFAFFGEEGPFHIDQAADRRVLDRARAALALLERAVPLRGGGRDDG